MSTYKNYWKISFRVRDSSADAISGCVVALKFSNEIPSIDIDLLPPYYYGVKNWLPLFRNNHDDTKYIEMIYGVWMICGVCCHSDVSLGYLPMAGEMADFVFL